MPVEEEEEEGEIVKETLYIGVFCDGTWQHRDVDRHRTAMWDHNGALAFRNRAHRAGHAVHAIGGELLRVRTEERSTHKALSIHYLHRMYDEAQAAGVPLDDMDDSEPGYRLPQNFQWAMEVWQNAGEPLDEARERWLLGVGEIPGATAVPVFPRHQWWPSWVSGVGGRSGFRPMDPFLGRHGWRGFVGGAALRGRDSVADRHAGAGRVARTLVFVSPTDILRTRHRVAGRPGGAGAAVVPSVFPQRGLPAYVACWVLR